MCGALLGVTGRFIPLLNIAELCGSLRVGAEVQDSTLVLGRLELLLDACLDALYLRLMVGKGVGEGDMEAVLMCAFKLRIYRNKV